LREFVDGRNIIIIRDAGAARGVFKVNVREVLSGENLEQNISLKPGDTVIVAEGQNNLERLDEDTDAFRDRHVRAVSDDESRAGLMGRSSRSTNILPRRQHS
jgi:hypothetical protein